MNYLHKKFEKKHGYLPDESIRIVHKHICDGKIGLSGRDKYYSNKKIIPPLIWHHYDILFDSKIMHGNGLVGTYIDARKCTYDFVDYINERMKELLK